MKVGLALGSVSAFAALVGCQPQPRPFTQQDAAAVRAVFDSTVPRIRAGNYAAWAQEFADDARFYAPNAHPVIGRAAILAWGQALPPVEQFEFFDVQVAGEGDLAWGTSGYSMTLKGAPADSGKQLVVLRRNTSGAWEVIAGSFNSNLPLPQPEAAKR